MHDPRNARRRAGDFQHALEESSIERGFSRNLHYERGILQVGEDLYDLGTFSRVFVVSFGKAAHSSLEALITRLGAGWERTALFARPRGQNRRFSGSGISRVGIHFQRANRAGPPRRFCAHSMPMNARSLVLYLISGGGSAIVEKPIRDEILI